MFEMNVRNLKSLNDLEMECEALPGFYPQPVIAHQLTNNELFQPDALLFVGLQAP